MSETQSPLSTSPTRFEGTDRYVATDDLKLAVNAALQRPLLQWHIKSTTKAHQGLYEYDAMSRLRDSQLGDEKIHNIRNYIVQRTLWQAFQAQELVVPADR